MSRSPARTSFAALVAVCLTAGGTACGGASGAVPPATRAAIADSLERLLKSAYDFERPDVPAALMSLYPDSGRVISASGGRVSTSRDSLAAGIRDFWTYVGQNMRDPNWEWGPFFVDVLSNDAAVVTASYRVPHRTPAGAPHVIGGAWTAAFARRDGRWVVIQEHLSDLPPEALNAPPPTAAPAHDAHGKR